MKLKYNDYIEMVKKVREITDFKPKIGIVLGTGLGSFVNRVDIKASIYYKDIPGLPISTNPAHQGRFIFGYFNGIPCVFMQGRVHYYEGFEAEEVIRPIRLMGVLGIKKLILTNAAGGINYNFQYPGPQFETKALIKAFRNMGADACGMSTAIEAVASNHMNIKTIAISFISNMACGIEKKKITDEEVVIEAKKAETNFVTLLGEAIKILNQN